MKTRVFSSTGDSRGREKHALGQPYVLHLSQYFGCLVISVCLVLYALCRVPVADLSLGSFAIAIMCFLILWASLLYGVCVDELRRIIPNRVCVLVALSGLCVAALLSLTLEQTHIQTPLRLFVQPAQNSFQAPTLSQEITSLLIGSSRIPLIIQVISVTGVLGASEFLWRKTLKTPGLGLGDIKLLSALSCWIGWGAFIVYLVALLGSCCVAIFRIMIRGSLRQTFAFGPAISLSFLSLFLLASMTVYT